MPNLVGIHSIVWAPNPNKQTDRQASFKLFQNCVLRSPPVADPGDRQPLLVDPGVAGGDDAGGVELVADLSVFR